MPLILPLLLSYWQRRLERAEARAADPATRDLWLWEMRARVLRYLIVRYSGAAEPFYDDPGAVEPIEIGLDGETGTPVPLWPRPPNPYCVVTPELAPPKRGRALARWLWAIRRENFAARESGRRWRWL